MIRLHAMRAWELAAISIYERTLSLGKGYVQRPKPYEAAFDSRLHCEKAGLAQIRRITTEHGQTHLTRALESRV